MFQHHVLINPCVNAKLLVCKKLPWLLSEKAQDLLVISPGTGFRPARKHLDVFDIDHRAVTFCWLVHISKVNGCKIIVKKKRDQ